MPKKIKIIIAALIVAAIVTTILFVNHSESNSRYQSTEDAYIRADSVIISPQVAGQIVKVLVKENQQVEKGELLAIIDDRKFSAQVASLSASLLSAEAVKTGIEGNLKKQESIIAQAKATLQANKASLDLAETDLKRYKSLASDGSGSKQAWEQADAQFKIQQANYERDKAKYESEIQQLTVFHADLMKADAQIAQAKAMLQEAELNLSYCKIYAPVSGIISQKSVRLGAYTTTGQPLMAVVPLNGVYIEAFFRETQLANIKPGQIVSIKVDAIPDKVFKGEVEAVGAASNASFSSIAPHSTTSNFTKIVQRLPVRIKIHYDNMPAVLRVGMSVVPKIDTSTDAR